MLDAGGTSVNGWYYWGIMVVELQSVMHTSPLHVYCLTDIAPDPHTSPGAFGEPTRWLHITISGLADWFMCTVWSPETHLWTPPSGLAWGVGHSNPNLGWVHSAFDFTFPGSHSDHFLSDLPPQIWSPHVALRWALTPGDTDLIFTEGLNPRRAVV